MRYMLLIYSPESIMANMNPTEQEGYMNEWFAYTADLQATGKMLAGDALQPVATATHRARLDCLRRTLRRDEGGTGRVLHDRS